ncbi:MAG: hypothetical protein R6V03_02480, partial [Kiritimatiellia bacterium]
MVHRNQWMHLGVVWDSTNGAAGVHTYIDGLEEPTWDAGSSDIQSLHSGAAEFTLGAYDIKRIKRPIAVRTPNIRIPGRPWRPRPPPERREKEIVINSFRGQMAQLVLCREVLTDLEVAELYMLGEDGDLQAWIHQDFDEDGMVDWWERENFGDVSPAAEGDEDGDGLSNLEEFEAGTDPNNPDSDNDGLTDGQEVHTYRTDPLSPDTDGDGAGDLEEVNAGTDPADPASFPADISGRIIYPGWQSGPVHVMAATSAQTWTSEYSTAIRAPQSAFRIENLPNLTSYWIKAYKDLNRNGVKDWWEAEGSYPANPIYLDDDIAGIDIELLDPDTDSDSLPDWWELTYLGGLSGTPDEDPDEDGVSSLTEYRERTDPTVSDTDRDGFPDGFEPGYGVSRAFIDWADSRYTREDDYIYTMPEWVERAYKLGGQWVSPSPGPGILLSEAIASPPTNPVDLASIDWDNPDMTLDGEKIYLGSGWIVRVYQQNGEWLVQEICAPLPQRQADEVIRRNPLLMPYVSALVDHTLFPGFNPGEWHVPSSEPEGEGRLVIELNRTIVSNDLRMKVQFMDYAGSSLYIELSDSDDSLIENLGNIMTGTGRILWKTNNIPLETFTDATRICLHRGIGEIRVSETILLIDQDGDGLDAGQEALLGTSDLSADSDGDGTGEKAEVDAGTDPADPASFPAAVSGS